MPVAPLPLSALPQALESAHLICVSTESNHNKQWSGWVFADGLFYSESGRVGYAQRAYRKHCGTSGAALRELRQTVAEKCSPKRGQSCYQPAATDQEAEAAVIDDSLFGAKGTVIQSHLDHLAELAQTIGKHTTITFNRQLGHFESTLGRVSNQTLEAAGQALAALVQERQRCEAPGVQLNSALETVKHFTEAYLRYIPVKVGMRLDASLLWRPIQQRQQQAVLAALREGLTAIQTVRGLIQTAIAESQWVGSEERACWLDWGEAESSRPVQPANDPHIIENSRAAYVEW